MILYEFDTSSGEIQESITDGARSNFLERRLRSIGLLPQDVDNSYPADRGHFFTNSSELADIIHGIGVTFVGPHEYADVKVKLPASARVPEPEVMLFDDEIQQIVADNNRGSSLLLEAIVKGRRRKELQAKQQAWWRRFASERYAYNVFEEDPTEQFVVGANQEAPITIYNFAERLGKSDLRHIVGALAIMSQMTEGYTRLITPYVVVHEAFKKEFFAQTQSYSMPSGQAWLGEPFIELRRSAFYGRKGSVKQSWLGQIITHEISHQIDYEVDPNMPDFANFFHYVDENGDGLIDYTRPKQAIVERYDEAIRQSSQPHRTYGLTDGYEDFGVAGEEVPFGGHIDRIRYDAYLSVIRQFIRKERLKRGDVVQLSNPVRIERFTGDEIKLPLVPAFSQPVKINAQKSSSFLSRMRKKYTS